MQKYIFISRITIIVYLCHNWDELANIVLYKAVISNF